MTEATEPRFARRVESINEPSEETIKTLINIGLINIGKSKSSVQDQPQTHSEQHGLFPIYVPSPETLATLPSQHETDIVAIHGIGGDYDRTWRHATGFNWLEHLHSAWPGIRVYSYGFNSGLIFSLGTDELTNTARHLLSLIKLTRKNAHHMKRNLIFVCHGFGGILAKQAILLANNERGLFEPILKSISALLFFATPHYGNLVESYGDVLWTSARALLFSNPANRLLENHMVILLKAILENAPTLRKLAEEFLLHARGTQVISFVEGTPLPGMKNVLVDHDSARVTLKNERAVPMKDHDYRQLCKHADARSSGYAMILAELRDVMPAATTTSAEQKVFTASDQNQLALRTSPRSFDTDTLLCAVATGNFIVTKRLIQRGTSPNVRDPRQRTALHIACEMNHEDIGFYLLEHGAFVAAIDNEGNQPLHLAAATCSKLAIAITKRGADVNKQNNKGSTPLHMAARVGANDLITHLLEQGADMTICDATGDLPGRVARKNHKLDAMRIFHKAIKGSPELQLVKRADYSAGGYLTGDERHAMYMAEHFPSVMTVNFDMDRKLKNSASELGQAARRGNLAAVEEMLDMGIEPSPEVLYLAAHECRSDVVDVIADVLDDLDMDVGWAGNALCTAACSSNGYITLKVLLEKGANVNWQGGKYGCALQAATANYRPENVRLLLEHGADVNAQCGHYGNALTAAARHQTSFAEMATLFLSLGADIDAQGPGAYGNPLQTAVHRCHVPNVEFLLQHGANSVIEGRFGSALDIARRHLSETGYIGNKTEKERILFLLTEEDYNDQALQTIGQTDESD